MKQWIKDTTGLGTILWLIGYLASLLLFQAPTEGCMFAGVLTDLPRNGSEVTMTGQHP